MHELMAHEKMRIYVGAGILTNHYWSLANILHPNVVDICNRSI